jgi:ribosomal protein S18 acetylase RimI-like enzyme
MPSDIRPAQPRDLIRLEEIENQADARFLDRFHPTTWRSAPTADERATSAGFILVAAETSGGDAVGFVQVVVGEALAHLEQLSVLPAYGRRGHGRALVEAAKAEAFLQGFEAVTLRTFAEIPWNGPFYSHSGFVETEPSTQFHLDMLQAETETGSARYGRRIQMTCSLR